MRCAVHLLFCPSRVARLVFACLPAGRPAGASGRYCRVSDERRRLRRFVAFLSGWDACAGQHLWRKCGCCCVSSWCAALFRVRAWVLPRGWCPLQPSEGMFAVAALDDADLSLSISGPDILPDYVPPCSIHPPSGVYLLPSSIFWS